VLLDADRLGEARETLEDAYQRGLALGHRFARRAAHVPARARAASWELGPSADALARGRGALGGRTGYGADAGRRALIEAHLGNIEVARAAAERSIGLLHEPAVVMAARAEWALGPLELTLGSVEVALRRLHTLVALFDEEPLRDAPAFRGAADAVEALLGLGRTAEARIMDTSVSMIDATYGHLVPDSEDYLRGLLDSYDSLPCRVSVV
jgi:hypothetical protein